MDVETKSAMEKWIFFIIMTLAGVESYSLWLEQKNLNPH